MKIIYENCGVKNYMEEGHRMIFFHITYSLALPSRQSSFPKPVFIWRLTSSLCTIFWKHYDHNTLFIMINN